MKAILVTGHRGLVGSGVASHLSNCGYRIIGFDCDIRKKLFNDIEPMQEISNPLIQSYDCDIRDTTRVRDIIKREMQVSNIKGIVHTAAQPSHDWAKSNPLEDYSLNSTATLGMLMLAQELLPDCIFIHFSTNKVYGDSPNMLPLVESDTRYELDKQHKYYDGIDETMSIDQTKHSLFGASKLAADIYVQEYARYFGLKTVVLRGGCLTGSNHRSTELHGFMNYLIKCAVTGKPYQIFGYKGKQVRDNLSSQDIASLTQIILEANNDIIYPVVANLGGGRDNSISILEIINKLEEDHELRLNYRLSEQARSGDHMWYITSNKRLNQIYGWNPVQTTDELIESTVNHYRRGQ